MIFKVYLELFPRRKKEETQGISTNLGENEFSG
jgi:hypothetical protein